MPHRFSLRTAFAALGATAVVLFLVREYHDNKDQYTIECYKTTSRVYVGDVLLGETPLGVSRRMLRRFGEPGPFPDRYNRVIHRADGWYLGQDTYRTLIEVGQAGRRIRFRLRAVNHGDYEEFETPDGPRTMIQQFSFSETSAEFWLIRKPSRNAEAVRKRLLKELNAQADEE